MANTYTGSDVGKAGLEVTEVDGSPDVFGVTKIVVSNTTLTDNGGGQVTITTGGGGGSGNTLDEAYDEGGAGSGKAITADSGAVAITVSNTSNNPALTITQSDTTNNPATFNITNSGTGDTFTATSAVGEVFTISNTEVVVNEGAGNCDFRVESDDGTDVFHVDASAGSNAGGVGFFGVTPVVQQGNIPAPSNPIGPAGTAPDAASHLDTSVAVAALENALSGILIQLQRFGLQA